MSNFFKNKRVWITGASSGIGEALALAFAESGAQLILSSRNEVEINRVSAACSKAGASAVIVQPFDLERHDIIPAIVESILKKVGKVDILINNGGISQRSLAKETSLEVDKKLMAVNYFGTVALTKALLPNMLMHQLGHIVTVTSLTGKFGSPYRSSYAAAKHALHGFFDSLRAEMHDAHIKVTLICPGFVRTNVSKNALTGAGEKLGTMDEATDKGMEPERLAHKILHAIEQGKEEVYFGGKEVLGVYLKRFFPHYFSKMLRKAKVR
ncbi:MAG: SDR family oxidoreductase [Saprospiraceae bacterium]|nr:SDR family oxidoreductase [Saprospiraceae bacterium]